MYHFHLNKETCGFERTKENKMFVHFSNNIEKENANTQRNIYHLLSWKDENNM